MEESLESLEESMDRRPKHLAYHETLEIHELVAFQSVGLMKLKNAIGEVENEKLHSLYQHSIMDLEENLRDLLPFYGMAPRAEGAANPNDLGTGFYAGDLLGLTKACIKNYAMAITETATPAVRETLANHLQKAIKCHTDVFNFMYENGMYPAYDLQKLLENDMMNANKALEMTF